MSIFHKAMLSGAIQVTGVEDDPQLQAILLEPTGEVVSINRWAVFATSPVISAVKTFLPIIGVDRPLKAAVAVPVAQVELLLKNIPKDVQFKGLLEHVSIINGQGNVLEAKFNDGRGERTMVLRSIIPHPFLVNWRTNFRNLGKYTPKSFVYNRARLDAIINAINSSCRYSGEFDFIAQEGFEHGYVWRTKNGQTGQYIIVAWVFPEATTDLSEWEKGLLKPTALVRPK